MFRDRPPRIVLKYYVYTLFNGPGFIYPVYVLYLLANGVSFTQLGIIGAVQASIIVGGEIPTGYVGDRVGRRDSLAVGQVLYVGSTVALLLGETFPVFLLGFVLMSLGRTFVSGSGSAWLYDTLEERLDEGRYTHIRGRGQAIEQYGTAATMVAGGALYALGPALPFVALLVTRVVTLVAVLRLPRTAQYAEDDGDDGPGVLTTVRSAVSNPEIRVFVGFMTLVFGLLLAVDPFIQPIAVDTLEASLGGVLASVGVPEPATLGVLYASFTAISAVASDRASDVEEWLGPALAVALVPALVAVLMVLPVVAPVVALPMFFGVKSGNSMLRPIAERYINDRVASAGRASVLSGASMVYALGRVPFVLGSGYLADVTSATTAVAALGGLLLVGSGLALVVRSPVAAGDESAPATGD